MDKSPKYVYDNILDLWDDENPRHWSEDFDHENGNYVNTCMFCKEEFRGHKRRVACKVCVDSVEREYNAEYY